MHANKYDCDQLSRYLRKGGVRALCSSEYEGDKMNILAQAPR